MTKITKTYRIEPEIAEMLKRLSEDELRTLSAELELAITARYNGKYGTTDSRGVYGLTGPRPVVEPAQEAE